MKCSGCGVKISFWRLSPSTLCESCAEVKRQEKEEEQQQAEEARRERKRIVASILRGESFNEDVGKLTEEEHRNLEENGFLFAAGRLIRCPICGHDRFHQQRTLMNTRGATFFNLDWLDSGADTRICQRCTHVMWFAR